MTKFSLLDKARSRFSRIGTSLFAIGFAVSASSCAIIPAAAPVPAELEIDSGAGVDPYFVVSLTPAVLDVLRKYPLATLKGSVRQASYTPSLAIRAGDVVAVTIYETGGPSIFGPLTNTPSVPAPGSTTTDVTQQGARSTTVPPQIVESNGEIVVPFAGRVGVIGLTPTEASRLIEKKFEGRAVGPQVIVTPVSTPNFVSVGGEANRTGQVPLTLRGERVLDVIAAAGGSKFPAHETLVRFIRSGQSGTIPLQQLLSDSSENIVVRPRDEIFLIRYPRSFAVMGATAKVSQYTFDTVEVSLAEAVARAGGPIDTIGNPSGIYLFRHEPIAIASAVFRVTAPADLLRPVGVDESWARQPYVRVVYKLDLRKADGYFLAQTLPMRDKDVVLVSNAELTQIQKAFSAARGLTGIAYDLSR